MSHLINDQLIEKCYNKTLQMSVDDFANKLAEMGYTYDMNVLIKQVATHMYQQLPEGDHSND